jgi:hypothetical protein
MANFFQVLEMMAIPAAFFVICRYLNVWDDGTSRARSLTRFSNSP